MASCQKKINWTIITNINSEEERGRDECYLIYISKCLIKGKLLNTDICILSLPQISCNQQTNATFDNITICIGQFNNNLFERYIIQSLLYEAVITNNVIFFWLIDSIRNVKQMEYNKYKLQTTP